MSSSVPTIHTLVIDVPLHIPENHVPLLSWVTCHFQLLPTPGDEEERERGVHNCYTHLQSFPIPNPRRQGQKRRRGTESWEGEEDEYTIATQDPHPYLHHTPSPLIPTTHLPTFNTHPYHSHPPPSPFTLSIPPHHTSSHTLTTHLHHSASPHPLTIHSTTHPPTLTTHPHHSPSPLTLTTHLHHSSSPPKLTTLAVVCCVSADSSPC